MQYIVKFRGQKDRKAKSMDQARAIALGTMIAATNLNVARIYADPMNQDPFLVGSVRRASNGTFLWVVDTEYNSYEIQISPNGKLWESAYDTKVRRLSERIAAFMIEYDDTYGESFDDEEDMTEYYDGELRENPREVLETFESMLSGADRYSDKEFKEYYNVSKAEARAIARDCMALMREKPGRTYKHTKRKGKKPRKVARFAKRRSLPFKEERTVSITARPIRMTSETRRQTPRMKLRVSTGRRYRSW